MELTPMKVPSGAYTMEVTYWNVHHGSYLMELTPRKVPSGTYTMEVTSWDLHHGSYLMELTPWNTSWNLHQ